MNDQANSDEVWAIIAARSGSKGMPGKNIKNLLGIPLLAHSINFAKKLPFVSKILVSTDSEEYLNLSKDYGAYVPFLRNSAASDDGSMEEDVLEDIRRCCIDLNVEPPQSVVWLRPTHPIRCVETFMSAYKKFLSGDNSSVCVVTEDDPRLFKVVDGRLVAFIDEFRERSMVRRQDCEAGYRIFSGEIFNFPTRYDKLFLGHNIGYEVAPYECAFDIDLESDFDYLEYTLTAASNKQRFAKYIHSGNKTDRLT